MKCLLHFTHRAIRIKLRVEHPRVLLPGSQAFGHLVFRGGIKVQTELLFDHEITEWAQIFWYLPHLQFHQVAIKVECLLALIQSVGR